MITARRSLSRLALVGAIIVLATPAAAHHVMDGRLPATLAQGFLSGLGHPIIGVDHLAFIVGVGLLAGLMRRKVLLPGIFVLGTLAGAWLHMMGLNLPWAEPAIILSVMLMAIIVIADIGIPVFAVAALFGVAGFLHGYAYGESIFGAEPSPLFAYLCGFALVQLAIAFGAAWAIDQIRARSETLAWTCRRVTGGGMAGIALAAISNLAFGG